MLSTPNLPFSIYAVFILILGIAMAHVTHHCIPYGALTMLNTALILALHYPLNRKKWALVALLALCAFLGAWRYTHLKNNHIQLLETITQCPLDLTGIIIDITPIQTRSLHRVTMRVQEYAKSNCPTLEPCNFILSMYTGKSHCMQTGDTITIRSARLKKNNADFTQYLLKQGVACSLFISAQQCSIVSRPALSVYRAINRLRTQLLNSIAKKLSTTSHTLFASLFLGNNKVNQHAMDNWSQLFRSWGLSHYLARSGLHLVLFVTIWLFILRITPIALAIKQLFLIILITLYALISWPSVSFYRALYTFMLCSWCIIRKKPIHYLHVLALVCFITLLHNPFCLMFLDFQLSYGLTFALGWFNYLRNRRATTT